MGLKTKILIGWLVVELAGVAFALPTAAKIIQGTLPQPMTRAASVELSAQAGLSRILVAADGPFVIIASGSTSDMRTHVEVRGAVNGNPFGKTAQNPGAGDTCNQPRSTDAHIIYKSIRETAKNEGPVIDQAVVLEIKYAADQAPVFEILTLDMDAAITTDFALPCSI